MFKPLQQNANRETGQDQTQQEPIFHAWIVLIIVTGGITLF